MDSEIARMFGKHLTSTVIDVCADFVGGFLLGSLVTWTAMREPLPMLEDGSGTNGKKVPFGNRMLVLARRTTREGIEIASIFAIVGIALWKTHNLMTNCLENDKRFWFALKKFISHAAVTVTGGKGGIFRK